MCNNRDSYIHGKFTLTVESEVGEGRGETRTFEYVFFGLISFQLTRISVTSYYVICDNRLPYDDVVR